MAIIKNGILGPAEGSIANLVTYVRLGKPTIRMNPAPTADKPRSPRQLARNARFALAMNFVKPNLHFLNVGFSIKKPAGLTAYNLAVSNVMEHGIIGEYPDLRLNFPNMLVANGDLAPAINPRVEMTAAGTMKFEWDVPEKLSYLRSRDQVMLLACMPEENAAFHLLSGARRNTGQELLEVYTGKIGQVYETYLAFISDDRKKISKSIYTGQVIVQ
jgi:hypothetical protein